jgi:polyferredoxin
VFSDQPLAAWLGISFAQTFVLIPLMVRRWGKGAYCGWICSCGALAETLGDTVRDRMPHGRRWNRLNLIGQGILVFAFALLLLRAVSWIAPTSAAGEWARAGFMAAGLGRHADWSPIGGLGAYLNYAWTVDLLLAGILGVGLYAHFSGRTWCRFGCPLAALMNVYAKFGTRFRILPDAKRCISCNLCTTQCHQGIDVMDFAQRGVPMDDPQCVRCSACIHTCPTAALAFGTVDPASGAVLGRDPWEASPVRQGERA